ncbi:hypothetical protein ACFRJ3_18615 [Streptomyces sp. NPDC056696]|uniref:hypothetical protein n=1 Tax=unclassified Streptomyces TaxID=2593676 RepID=UPI0036CC8064
MATDFPSDLRAARRGLDVEARMSLISAAKAPGELPDVVKAAQEVAPPVLAKRLGLSHRGSRPAVAVLVCDSQAEHEIRSTAHQRTAEFAQVRAVGDCAFLMGCVLSFSCHGRTNEREPAGEVRRSGERERP